MTRFAALGACVLAAAGCKRPSPPADAGPPPTPPALATGSDDGGPAVPAQAGGSAAPSARPDASLSSGAPDGSTAPGGEPNLRAVLELACAGEPVAFAELVAAEPNEPIPESEAEATPIRWRVKELVSFNAIDPPEALSVAGAPDTWRLHALSARGSRSPLAAHRPGTPFLVAAGAPFEGIRTVRAASPLDADAVRQVTEATKRQRALEEPGASTMAQGICGKEPWRVLCSGEKGACVVRTRRAALKPEGNGAVECRGRIDQLACLYTSAEARDVQKLWLVALGTGTVSNLKLPSTSRPDGSTVEVRSVRWAGDRLELQVKDGVQHRWVAAEH